MEMSRQEFYATTGLMLDSKLPPSSHFCVPEGSPGTLLYTSAGDVLSGKTCCKACSIQLRWCRCVYFGMLKCVAPPLQHSRNTPLHSVVNNGSSCNTLATHLSTVLP